VHPFHAAIELTMTDSSGGHDPSEPSPNTSIWIAAMPATFVVLWSSGFIGAKFGLPYAEPLTFLSWRFLFVAIVMGIISFLWKAPWPSDWRLAGHIAIAGLLVQATYLGGVFTSIHHGLPAGLSALITGLQPALTAVLAILFLQERVSKIQWLGVGLGLAGVILVVARKMDLSIGAGTAIWLAVIALLGITLGTIYQKRFCAEMDLRTGSVIQFSASGLIIWGLALWLETEPVQWTEEFIFALTWLVFVLSIGAISLLILLIRRGAASKVASLFYLVPPVTALMAYFIFGETLGAIEVAGMGMAAVGVALVTKA